MTLLPNHQADAKAYCLHLFDLQLGQPLDTLQVASCCVIRHRATHRSTSSLLRQVCGASRQVWRKRVWNV